MRVEHFEGSEWRSPLLIPSTIWSRRNISEAPSSGGGGKVNKAKGSSKGGEGSSGSSGNFEFGFENGACEIPYDGVLEFFFIEGRALQDRKRKSAPLVHFNLNMAKHDDRGIMRTMLSRSRREPGDNIVAVKINHELMSPPFDGHNNEAQRRLVSLVSGQVSFGYSTTMMRHEQHWKLDLSLPSDNAIAHKLLERVYKAAIKEMQQKNIKKQKNKQKHDGLIHTSANMISTASQETWTNTTLNGKPFQLQDWAIDFGKISGSILQQREEEGACYVVCSLLFWLVAALTFFFFFLFFYFFFFSFYFLSSFFGG